MKKVIIRTDDKKVSILYSDDDEEFVEVTGNTNIINTEELLFNESYLKKNSNIIASFIRGVVLTKNVSTLSIVDEGLIDVSIDIAKNIKEINNICIECNTSLSFEVFEKLKNYDNLKHLNCYDMQQFMFEELDRENLKIDLRNETGLKSNFVKNNDLNHYSDIYYKSVVKVVSELDDNDINDFNTFCKVNRKLKEVEIYNFSIKLVRKVIKLLVKNNIRNIRISIIPDQFNDSKIADNVEVFKFINKKYSKSFGIKVKVKYSKEYKEKNLMKQINVVSLRTCTMIIAFVLVSGFVIIEYKNYKASEDIDKMEELVGVSDTKIEDNNSDEVFDEELIEDDVPDDVSEKQASVTSYEDYEKLLSVNPETVGWLTVNNTKINYPVVKHEDNDYYLKHNFYNYSTNLGWIFMDYRNSVDELNKNTIIYGHSNTRGDIMFGSMYYVLNESWYKNQNNQVITFNTVNKNMKWQIFSIYLFEPVSDYLYTRFTSDEKYLEFINMIKDRSIYNFNVGVSADDNILTLSTCHNHATQRLVIHAKLIKE